MRIHLSFAIPVLILAACTSPTSSKSIPTIPVSAPLTIGGSAPQVQTAASVSPDNQKVSLTLNLGSTPQRVYFVLTNESASAATSGMPSISGNVAASTSRAVTAGRSIISRRPRVAAPTPDFVLRANAAASARISAAPASRSAASAPSYDSSPTAYTSSDIGTGHTTYIPAGGGSIPCTLEAVVDQSAGSQKRKLFVWVANNCLDTSTTTTGTYTYQGSGSSEPFLVTRAQAQALATAFLNTTGDIYGYDTSIYGKEYPDYVSGGTPPASGLITPQGEIHIFIADLNSTSSTKGDGGVLGYFYAADNYTSSVYSDSNQKIMFQLDAASLGNPTTNGDPSSLSTGVGQSSPTWSLSTSYWPNQIQSTLAHEFQHMIHFYQKQITYGLSAATDTWINEMCSVVTEDFVGSNIQSLGPRGVQFTSTGAAFAYSPFVGNLITLNSAGNAITSSTFNDPGSRVAFFNEYYPTVSLESWGDTGSGKLANYGMAFTFGSWLARNYGGPQLFHAIVSNAYTDEQAVVTAVNSLNGTSYTMPQLIEQWAATMVMGSQATTAPNAEVSTSGGYFTATSINTAGEGGNTFQYGSIDPTTYYPYYYDASNNSNSGLDNQLGAGPRVFSNFSGVSSIPARAFYYYTPSRSGLTGTQTYTVTIPPNVHFDVVTVPGT